MRLNQGAEETVQGSATFPAVPTVRVSAETTVRRGAVQIARGIAIRIARTPAPWGASQGAVCAEVIARGSARGAEISARTPASQGARPDVQTAQAFVSLTASRGAGIIAPTYAVRSARMGVRAAGRVAEASARRGVSEEPRITVEIAQGPARRHALWIAENPAKINAITPVN